MNKKTIEQVVAKEMPEFAQEAATLSADDLSGRLAQFAIDFDEVEKAKEADEELENTRKKLSELGAPYKDSKKALRLKSKYIISLLKEKGAL